ncbi:hypothetical protein GCM10019016_016020 [Streptomyces prasinosporus]|uniref:Uncharacterized protein n=1 Tax=Streptomyces prasinosporus TaxID=68256 RepID=A0ABP6TJ61_9ACTN
MYQILSDLQLIDSYLGLILVYCSTAVPYCAWLMKGYFDTIPFEIDEAGTGRRAEPIGTFARLILPLAKPGSRGRRVLQLSSPRSARSPSPRRSCSTTRSTHSPSGLQSFRQ